MYVNSLESLVRELEAQEVNKALYADKVNNNQVNK